MVPEHRVELHPGIQQRPIRTVIVGIVVPILTLIAIVVAGVTVLGLPLALITLLVFLFFGALSEVPVAVWLGERIMHSRTPLGRQSTIVNFFIGALILLVLGVVPVLGGIVTFVASCVGFGALLFAAWAARERQLT